MPKDTTTMQWAFLAIQMVYMALIWICAYRAWRH